jgi:hypothetical protein
MNHGSFCIIPVIRYGCRYEMKCQKESVKSNTEKRLISFLWSDNGIHSLVDVPKGSAYNSAFFYDPVVLCLLDGITFHSRKKRPKVYICTWTIHVRIMQGDPMNVFMQKRSIRYRTRLTART